MRLVIVGGAGYIGSALTAAAHEVGLDVTVVDSLRFGGEALLPLVGRRRFELLVGDVRNTGLLKAAFRGADAVVHLAALVGFPACERAGRDETWSVNVDGTRSAYEVARDQGVDRFVFASSYSNYGRAETEVGAVSEDSPLVPLSIYAESKVAAERYLLEASPQARPHTTCLRLATVFGLSGRTRFDLMVNQFVLEAFARRRLVVYQQDFKRSFVHVRDVGRAILEVIGAPAAVVSGQVFNIGADSQNMTKSALVEMLCRRWPDLHVERRHVDFGGDMRSLQVSYAKVRRALGFETTVSVEAGIDELAWALEHGVIGDPWQARYRNHEPLVS